MNKKRNNETWAVISIRHINKPGFREAFCELHGVSSGPCPTTIASEQRLLPTKWCPGCRKLTRCLRIQCEKLDIEDLWLCSSCGIHRCKHLCHVKVHETAICNGCRHTAVNDPIIETVELKVSDSVLSEIKKLQPVLAPDREREWPWVIKRLKHKKILDAACGGGFLQKYLLNLDYDVLATDFDINASFYAADGPRRDKFYLQDLRKQLPVEWHQAFNHVLLISTVEHLEGDDDTLVVKNLASCLKDGTSSMFLSFPYGVETEWRKIGNNTERFYSENGLYERLILPARLKICDREVFTKEELDWPWKDIMVVEAVKT